jgi:hypothetical protein
MLRATDPDYAVNGESEDPIWNLMRSLFFDPIISKLCCTVDFRILYRESFEFSLKMGRCRGPDLIKIMSVHHIHMVVGDQASSSFPLPK